MSFKAYLPQASSELRSKLQKLLQYSDGPEPAKVPQFSANLYQVEGTSAYRRLSESQRQDFLQENARHILNEAIYIEQAGIAYANRMAFLAENQEERYYYTQVAKEEFEHLKMLKPYFKPVASTIPSFPRMIGDVIEQENHLNAILFIQVLLEGWGLYYYNELAKYAESPELQAVFSQILKDESRHHGGGLVLLAEYSADSTFQGLNFETLKKILFTIQIGPYQVATSLGWTAKIQRLTDLEQLLQELYAEETTREKLALVERLLAKVLDERALEVLRREGSLNPLSLEEMVGIMAAELGIPTTPDLTTVF
jgi:rubrerythrin